MKGVNIHVETSLRGRALLDVDTETPIQSSFKLVHNSYILAISKVPVYHLKSI